MADNLAMTPSPGKRRSDPDSRYGMPHVLDYIDVCPLCRRVGVRSRGEAPVCSECIQDLHDLPGPFELHLERPEGAGTMRVRAATLYGGIVTHALELVKFAGYRAIGSLLGGELFGASDRMPPGVGSLLIVPASLAGRRRRGFDQTMVLVTASGCAAVPALRRTGTGTQKHRSRAQRLEHAASGLAVDEAIARSARAPVWIADDVLTSGATVAGVASLVEAAGIEVAGAYVLAWRRGRAL